MSRLQDLSAVVARAQAGQPAALSELYSAYCEPLRRFCHTRLGDAELAQDCVQDTFLHAWQALPTVEYRGEAAFVAWLYTIANHKIIDSVRKRQRRQQLAVELEPQHADPRNEDSRRICDRLTVQAALRDLPSDQQHVITLKFFFGLSNQEIATTLGRSEGAVKALQHRGINRLHRMLEPKIPAALPEPAFNVS
jgi:RNA polymerase sigma-70 factor, ECF subfamily